MAKHKWNPIDRAMQSLNGLSVGDSLGATIGEGVSSEIAASYLENRMLPEGPWLWTDDTHMALSVVEVLAEYEEIDRDELAARFAQRFDEEPYRGYAEGARWLLSQIFEGGPWRRLARELFEGGSYGNGAAMRAAPIGAFYSGAPKRAASEARKSAVITHAHRDGQAGAIAVAVAASIVNDDDILDARQFLSRVIEFVPDSETRDGIAQAMQIQSTEFDLAVKELGTGWHVSAQDTVPFCLWCIAHQRTSFEEAIWLAIAGGGDRDTTCAIVGGIAALSSTIPEEWLIRRESLPDDFAVS